MASNIDVDDDGLVSTESSCPQFANRSSVGQSGAAVGQHRVTAKARNRDLRKNRLEQKHEKLARSFYFFVCIFRLRAKSFFFGKKNTLSVKIERVRKRSTFFCYGKLIMLFLIHFVQLFLFK